LDTEDKPRYRLAVNSIKCGNISDDITAFYIVKTSNKAQNQILHYGYIIALVAFD
jgi:hypothetical protein